MSDGHCWSCGGYDERTLVANGKTWCRECAAGEIELLVAAIASWKAEEVEWKETETKLLARMEELEELEDLLSSGAAYIVVTVGQIDAAVEWANAPEAGGGEWAALNRFNIFQCNYRPFGGIRSIEPGEHLNERCPNCAPFTGHGWVIGGEGE